MKILIILIATVLASQQGYYSGKVLILKENTCHRSLYDFSILLIAFESKACPLISSSKTNNFTQFFKDSAMNMQIYLKNNQLPYNIQYARVNYEDSPKCFEAFNVTQTPTIKLFFNATDSGFNLQDFFDYTDYERLTNWVIQKLTPIQKLPLPMEHHKTYVIEIGCSNRLDEQRKLDNYNEYHCHDDKTIGGYTFYHGDIVIMKQGKLISKHHRYDDLPSWIRRYEQGYVRKLDDHTMHLIFAKKYPAFILLSHMDEDSKKSVEKFEGVAKQFIDSYDKNRNRILFVNSYVEDNLQLHVEMRSYIGKNKNRYPYPHLTYLVTDDEYRTTKYHMEKFKPQELKDWIHSAYEGKQPVYKKSQDFEEDLKLTDLFESISYDNLEQLIENPQQQLVIYVRSSYVDEHLTDLLKAVKDLNIPEQLHGNFVKLSYSDNDLPDGMVVKSLPQMIYLNRQRTVQYMEGEHTVKNMQRWLEKVAGGMHRENTTQTKMQDKEQL